MGLVTQIRDGDEILYALTIENIKLKEDYLKLKPGVACFILWLECNR